MAVTGIICEYNPFHKGHAKQIRYLKDRGDTVVCLMSGDYVQRGEPALLDKSLRAKAALEAGADLVLELPVQVSLSSAEGFAAGGVGILSILCDTLCFGAEHPEDTDFFATAEALLSNRFTFFLREELAAGVSFPRARQAALERMGVASGLLVSPNDILGVEYAKAILAGGKRMKLEPIFRGGDYHADVADRSDPSATSLRKLFREGGDWTPYVPNPEIFRGAALHTLEAGERAVLAKLRSMDEAEFEALPYGSEGLWRKFQTACERERTIEDILEAAKSKRYTRTRLNRMLLCAFLGLTDRDMKQAAPYVRLLGLSQAGGRVLRGRKNSFIVNAGERKRCPYEERERKFSALYGLFALDATEGPVRRGQVVFPSGFPSVQGQKDVL